MFSGRPDGRLQLRLPTRPQILPTPTVHPSVPPTFYQPIPAWPLRPPAHTDSASYAHLLTCPQPNRPSRLPPTSVLPTACPSPLLLHATTHCRATMSSCCGQVQSPWPCHRWLQSYFDAIYGGAAALRAFHVRINGDPQAAVGAWEGGERTVQFVLPVNVSAVLMGVIGECCVRNHTRATISACELWPVHVPSLSTVSAFAHM